MEHGCSWQERQLAPLAPAGRTAIPLVRAVELWMIRAELCIDRRDVGGTAVVPTHNYIKIRSRGGRVHAAERKEQRPGHEKKMVTEHGAGSDRLMGAVSGDVL